MPSLPREYYQDLDLNKNQVVNTRIQNITSAARILLGGSLTINDKGLFVYDVDLLTPYFWDGATWVTVSSTTTWGTITGTVTNQTDLISYLSGNYYPLSSNPAGYLTIGTLPPAVAPTLQQVVNTGNGISNFGGIGNASIQSTNFTNGRTLYLNDSGFPTIRLVDNANASNYLQIDIDTLSIDGISYNWSSIVNPPASPFVALPFTTDHITANSNPYLIPGDWNSTSGNNQILNKPTIPTVTPSALSKVDDTNVTLTLGGTPNTALLDSVSLTLGWTGTLDDSRITSAVTWNGKQDGYTNLSTIGGLANSAGYLYNNGSGVFSYSTPTGVILFGTAAGTDTYTTTITGPTAYNDGDAYIIRFTNGNATTSTLDINGIGAKTIYRNNDGPVVGGDIWDGAEMLCIYNSVLDAFDCIGTSPNALFAYVTNADSVPITKGQVVYAFGGTGDRMTVKLANNSGDATSAQTAGVVVSTSIAAGQKGIIITQGLLDGLSILPTATYLDGDPLYLGSTPGSITKVKPYAPAHLVYLGNVTTANNGSAGRWYVRIQNGYELDELHNVQATSPTINDVLYYFGGSPGQWKTASISSVLGYTPASANGTINELAYFTGSTTLGSLATATYPSLTELSYVKGVSSDIQTQLNGKQSALTFSTGLTNTTGTITSNLSTGVSGGQSVIGGTAASNTLTLLSTSDVTKGKILFGTSAYDEVNNRLGVANASPASLFQVNYNANTPTVSDANGVLLANSTAATAGIQSVSPATVWQGNGWKTTATAASQDVRFRAYALPVQGTTNPTGQWIVESNINNAGYSQLFSLTSGSGASIGPVNYSPGKINISSYNIKTAAPTENVMTLSSTEVGPSTFPTQLNFLQKGATVGWTIQSVNQGVGYTPLILNELGSNVLIGTTTNQGAKLNVNGTIRGSQFLLSALNTAPATASSTGTTGEIRIVNGFIYVCVATNTWQRAAISTW